jgi:hypothetical protein
MDKNGISKSINKKLIPIMIIIIAIISIERIRHVVSSDIIPAKVVSCDGKWVEDTESYNDDAEILQYVPMALSENGDKAAGYIMMPTSAMCSQMIGKDISMLVDKNNPKNNKIFSFIQFFALSLFILAIPTFYLIGIYSIAGTRISCFLFYVVFIYYGLSETGTLEKYFPKIMTGVETSQSESALKRCVNVSLSKEGINNRDEIKKLACQDEEISDLSSIKDLLSLEELYIQNNSLISLEGLKPFTKLIKISVAGNKALTSTKGIGHAVNLEEFQANKSAINDLTGMDKLKKLKVIGLMQNNVSDVSVFSEITSLEDITFSYNNISDISAFSKSINITKASFSNNNITDVAPFSTMKQLEWFTAYSNNISDITSLYEVSTLSVFGVNGSVPCEQIKTFKSKLNLEDDSKFHIPKRCK